MRNRKWAEEKAKKLVGQMTLEEKASQLRYDSPAIKRLNIPEYNWWNEALHGVARAGVATVFPQAIALAAMFDDVMLKKIANVIAIEGRAKYNESQKKGDKDIYKGLTFWSPNINIFRDPRWGRGHETYGEDPYLTSKLGVAFVKGLQGEGKYLKAAACAKHFAVHSGPEAKRHYFNAKISKKDLWETYLPAFEALVKEANVESVMGAYNRTNGEPCCANFYLMQIVLRGLWNFKGHFVSDCWAIKDFHENHKVTKSPEESVSLALKSGCDLNCGCTYQYILNAIKKGLIKEENIDIAATRLFTTRYLLGMFEKTPYDSISYTEIESKEHIKLSINAARKSIVLLKNDGILPLDKNKLKSIAVIGPNANSRLALIGNYHGTSSRYITVLEGIQDELKNDDIKINYSKGCHIYEKKEEKLAYDNDRISEALCVAENSEIVILCLGLDETIEGEQPDIGNAYAAGDKLDLKLPGNQNQLLEKIIKINKPTIVILMSGSAIDLCYADKKASGIIQAWYPGARGGKAVADILFGNTSPSGKLPVTFYKSLEKLSPFEDYNMKGKTYRFLEDNKNVLYPFGYGLNYGKAEILNIKLEEYSETFEVKVLIQNLGEKEIEEVLQVYIKDFNPLATKNASLCGFKRIKIKDKTEAKLLINKKCLESVDDEGNKKIRGKKYKFYIGFSQPDVRSIELMNKKPIELEYIFK